MKKIVSIVTMAALLLTATPALAVDVVVADKQINYQNDQPPVIQNGRTLVPLRSIFEALGANVEWNAETQMVTGKKDDKTIEVQINNPIAKINGTETHLDVPATIINNRTMVPVRFIAESMGSSVEWLQANQTVYIDSKVPEIKNTFKEATVTDVKDGDTIVVSVDNTSYTVRLIGVDTPEVYGNAEFFGQEASNFTKKSLAVGSVVYLQRDVTEFDEYGRLLRYVWTARPTTDEPTFDEIKAYMFNASLVMNGYAAPYTYPPDVKYARILQQLSQDAFNGNWGLWGKQENKAAGHPVAPLYIAKPAPTHTTTPTYSGTTSGYGKIKGNINSKGQKIYHVPGGAFYNRTHAERWFNTEAEAIAAGFRRSKR